MTSHRMDFKLLILAAVALSAFAQGAARAEIAVVLNSRDDDMSLIDTTTYKVVKRVPLGKEPHHLIPTPDGKHIILGNAAGNDMVLLDATSGDIVKRYPRIPDPYHLGYSPDQKWFVVTANRLDRVDIYRHDNGNFALAAKVPMPKTTSHIAFSPDSGTVYVTVQESHEVAAIDLPTQQVKWKVKTGTQPAGIWLTPDTKHALVGVMGEDYVDVLATGDGKSVKHIKTGKGAHALWPRGDGKHVFITNRVDNTVSTIDMHKLEVVDSFPVPGGPDCIEIRKDGSEMWVTSRWINRVSVIDLNTKKLKHSIPVGRSPHGIYFQSHAARH